MPYCYLPSTIDQAGSLEQGFILLFLSQQTRSDSKPPILIQLQQFLCNEVVITRENHKQSTNTY